MGTTVLNGHSPCPLLRLCPRLHHSTHIEPGAGIRDGRPHRSEGRIVSEIILERVLARQRPVFARLINRLDEEDVLVVTKMVRLGCDAMEPLGKSRHPYQGTRQTNLKNHRCGKCDAQTREALVFPLGTTI